MKRNIAGGIAGILALTLTAGTALAGDQLFEGLQVVHITLNGKSSHAGIGRLSEIPKLDQPHKVLAA